MKFIKENWFKIILAICIVVTSLSFWVFVKKQKNYNESGGLKIDIDKLRNSTDRLPSEGINVPLLPPK